MEFNEGEFAFEIFSERRAVLDPVPAVHVKNIPQVANFRPVNVPANHAGHPALARKLNHRVLVIRHVFHRRLGLELDIRRERPITKTQRPARAIYPDVHVQDAIVKNRAHAIQQPVKMG